MVDRIRKVVLAYSGGLDTSVILRWIKEKYGAEIVAFCADIGQAEELSGLEAKAKATGASELAGRLAQRLNGMKFDPPQTLRLLKSIAADGDGIAEQGERAAEQATMALDSLFIAYSKNGKLVNDSEIRAGINGLFQQLDDPSLFNGFKFAAAMKNLSSLLP